MTIPATMRQVTTEGKLHPSVKKLGWYLFIFARMVLKITWKTTLFLIAGFLFIFAFFLGMTE